MAVALPREDVRSSALEIMRRMITERHGALRALPMFNHYMSTETFANWVRDDEQYIQDSMEITLIKSQLNEIHATNSPDLAHIIDKRQQIMNNIAISVAPCVIGSMTAIPHMFIVKIQVSVVKHDPSDTDKSIFVLMNEQHGHPSISEIMCLAPSCDVDEVLLMTDKFRFFMFAGPKVNRDRVAEILKQVFPDIANIERRNISASSLRYHPDVISDHVTQEPSATRDVTDYLEFIVTQKADYSLTGEQVILANARIKCLCVSAGIPVCENYYGPCSQTSSGDHCVSRDADCAIILSQPKCCGSIIYLSRKILIDQQEGSRRAIFVESISDQLFKSEKTVLRAKHDEIIPINTAMVAQNERISASQWIAEHPPSATTISSALYSAYVSDARSRDVRSPLSIQSFSKVMISRGYRHTRDNLGRRWMLATP